MSKIRTHSAVVEHFDDSTLIKSTELPPIAIGRLGDPARAHAFAAGIADELRERGYHVIEEDFRSRGGA